MSSDRPVSELAKIIPDMLKERGKVIFSPQGISMRPTICQGDTVTLSAVTSPKRYDILFYTRSDGKAVLHRLIAFDKNGGYIMRGDNCLVKEFGITDKDIVAVVTAIEKNGRKYSTSGALFNLCSFFTVMYGTIRAKIKKIIRVIIKGK